MNQFKFSNIGFFVVILFIFSSCAAGYKSIKPESVHYGNTSKSNGISFSYKDNILEDYGNSRYAKKSIKKQLKVIAVRVINGTEKTITFAENIKMYAGKQLVLPIESTFIQSQIKQTSALYLLYFLLWMNISKCENNDCTHTWLPIGLPIGLGNMIAAESANKKLLVDLNTHNILHREINPGETVYGLIGIKDPGYQALKIEFEE